MTERKPMTKKERAASILNHWRYSGLSTDRIAQVHGVTPRAVRKAMAGRVRDVAGPTGGRMKPRPEVTA